MLYINTVYCYDIIRFDMQLYNNVKGYMELVFYPIWLFLQVNVFYDFGWPASPADWLRRMIDILYGKGSSAMTF